MAGHNHKVAYNHDHVPIAYWCILRGIMILFCAYYKGGFSDVTWQYSISWLQSLPQVLFCGLGQAGLSRIGTQVLKEGWQNSVSMQQVPEQHLGSLGKPVNVGTQWKSKEHEPGSGSKDTYGERLIDSVIAKEIYKRSKIMILKNDCHW